MQSSTTHAKNIVAQQISFFLKQKGISRKQLCNDLDFKYTTVCDWINGKSEPKFENLEKMSKYFGITVADFFIEFETPTQQTSRLLHYANSSKELNMDILEMLNDNQIKELLDAGFIFKKLSLKEYAEKLGRPIIPSHLADWGEPMGDEIW